MKHCTGMRRGPIHPDYPQPIPVDTVISNGALKTALVLVVICALGYVLAALLIVWL
jgi:hypothetical protein